MPLVGLEDQGKGWKAIMDPFFFIFFMGHIMDPCQSLSGIMQGLSPLFCKINKGVGCPFCASIENGKV